MSERKKLVIAFLLSLTPMLASQYGGMRGVQEISGLINLLCPLGIGSVILFCIGFKYPLFYVIGSVGMVISELYQFLTWHILTITGEFSLRSSFEFAFPEFYIGVLVSVLMVLYSIQYIKKRS